MQQTKTAPSSYETLRLQVVASLLRMEAYRTRQEFMSLKLEQRALEDKLHPVPRRDQ